MKIFRWDGGCLWHSTSYYARATAATYDSLMGIKRINFEMVFGLRPASKTSFMHIEVHLENASILNQFH